MSPDELIRRGESARRLLNDPLFMEAMERIEKDVFEAWSRSAIRDKEGQHELLLMIQTARKFKAIFEDVLLTGELETKALQKPRLVRELQRFGVFNGN